MSTLWRREEFLRICSKEELAEKAQDIKVTIPVKKSQETRYNLDPGSFFVDCFGGRRPDWVAINEALKIVYILEFKRSTDWDERFLEVKDAEANEQHKSIIGPLKTAAPKWEFEKITFVVGPHCNRGLVVESGKYNNARDVVTVLLIFAKYLSRYLQIFTCTYRGTHTQAHMYNQHTRGMATTRHRSLVKRSGRKALLETLHTPKKKNVRKKRYSRISRKDSST